MVASPESTPSPAPAGRTTELIESSGSSEYLAKRTLRTGTAGWVLPAGLGVSYVISGDYCRSPPRGARGSAPLPRASALC